MKVANPTIGTDFELFLLDTEAGEVISAEGYIKGSKEEPFVFDPENKYFSTTLDNVLAEATIPPVTNAADFYRFIQKSVEFLKTQIPRNVSLMAFPAARLNEKWLQTEHAKTFGCMPDFCVWTRSMNPMPCAEDSTLRSAGGHIHIGYDNPRMEINEQIIKAMDLFIGVPSMIQEPDNERKLLYGKAGCFRPKNYGVEYRTVSNYYLGSKELTEWVFNNTMAAVDLVNLGGIEGVEPDYGYWQECIVNAINQNDKKLAEKIIQHFGIKLAA